MVSDDIVTRLRHKYAGQLHIRTEAAYEIERLRDLVAEYRNLYLLRSRLEDQLEATDRR